MKSYQNKNICAHYKKMTGPCTVEFMITQEGKVSNFRITCKLGSKTTKEDI